MENQETGETVTLIVSPYFVLAKTLLRFKNCIKNVPLVLLEVEGQWKNSIHSYYLSGVGELAIWKCI